MARTIKFLLCLPLMITMAPAFGQVTSEAREYINLNNLPVGYVQNISADNLRLDLEYHDFYGELPDIRMDVYDGERRKLRTLTLDKSPGLNHYSIDLTTAIGTPLVGNMYYFEFENEKRKKIKAVIRITEPPSFDLSASVMVFPVVDGCGDASTTALTEFYGQISGGRAPYEVKWFVLDEGRSEFLYQPRSENIAEPGKTAKISVDRKPAYSVVLYVKDACGEEKKSIVTLVCDEDKKKINTIFAEPLDNMLINHRGGENN